ncbi:TPA: hypothetical protein ACGO1T_000782 [Streptococcus suis]
MKVLALLASLLLAAQQPLVVLAQETSQAQTSDQEETSSQAQVNVQDQSVISQDSGGAAIQAQPAQAVDYGFSKPEEILQTLLANPTKLSSGLNLLFTDDDVNYQGTSRAYIKDGDYYYFVTSAPETMSSAVLIETVDGQFDKSYILAQDLADYAAQALNQYPQAYADTEVEDFYIYAQENYQALMGLYIDNPQAFQIQSQLFQESLAIQQFILQLFQEFLSTEGLEPQITDTQEMGQIYTYTIGQEQAKVLADLAQPLSQADPILADFLAMFEAGYVGTLGFSLQTGDMALSIGMVDGSSVLEYVIGLEESTIKRPDPDRIIDLAAFKEMTGVDLFGSQDSQ